ncbi:MAG: hypothetical protein OXC07_12210, partial [Kistimonas sp.]|nr:hypothetical protein [Kistimonas sp.]
MRPVWLKPGQAADVRRVLLPLWGRAQRHRHDRALVGLAPSPGLYARPDSTEEPRCQRTALDGA